MPIVLISLIKSLFSHQHFESIHINALLIILTIIALIIALLLLLFIELTEYRLNYRDIMNNANKNRRRI